MLLPSQTVQLDEQSVAIPPFIRYPTLRQLTERVQQETLNALSDSALHTCLLYTSPSPRDKRQSRMPSSA